MTWRQRARAAVVGRRWLAIGGVVFVFAAVAFRLGRHTAGFWAIDDAGITYAAAFEYADHGTVAAYLEGTPVETYSNPLVFFVVALLRLVHLFDPVVSPLRIETLLFATMTILVWATLRRLTHERAAIVGAAVFVTAQLLTPATWMWYGSGLENVWVSTGIIALLWLCVRTADGVPLAPGWGIVGVLAALTRPEAPVYVAGFYAALGLCSKPSTSTWRHHARQVGLALAVTGALFVGFLAWRHIKYGDWLPNTYYAKIATQTPPLYNLRHSVIESILPYAYGWVFPAGVIALAAARRFRIAAVLAILTIASFALPIAVGADFTMAEHRFATPFFAVAHATLAVLVAVCVAGVLGAHRRGRVIAAAGLLVIAFLLYRLAIQRLDRGALYLDDVTIARVGELQGGERWELQMRLGTPYGVTMLPDAGGTLLVGASQYVDNGYLADFTMAHIGRNFGDPVGVRQLNQYVHEERRPDLASSAGAIGFYDASYVGDRYVAGVGHLMARREIVEVAAPPTSPPIFADDRLRLWLSDETVLTAGPGGLVRVELIVAWDDPAIDHVTIRGAVAGGDEDTLSLTPYQPGPHGLERRALLIGAPARGGPASITLELARDHEVIFHDRLATLDVLERTDDAGWSRAASALVHAGSPLHAARTLAWLREQTIPRLGMTAYHRLLRALLRDHAARRPGAGRDLLRLRQNVRLATLEQLPASLRAAELTASQQQLATCAASASASSPPAGAARIGCLGRAIDELRRLGYLGVLGRVPDLAAELTRAGSSLDRLPADQRYLALVGLTLADPGDVALQRQLLAARRALDHYPPLPVIDERFLRTPRSN